jgi:predicted Zn-dependent protease
MIPLLVVALQAAPVKPKPPGAETLWNQASRAHQAGQWAQCKISMQRFLKAEPKSGPGHALLGLCQFQLKEYGSALANLERAGELGMPVDGPLTSAAQYHAAVLQTKAQNFERALQLCRFFTARNEESPEITVVAGLAGLRKPIFPEEIAPAERALIFRTGRAMLLALDRRIAPADKMFQELLAAYPNTPNLHYAYATLLLRADPDRGLEELKRELAIAPDHLPALVSLADELMKRGNLDDAVEMARRAASAGVNNFVARAIYGKALLESGDPHAAIRELEIAAKLEPGSPQVHFSLAAAYAKAGRKEDAAKSRAEFARLRQIAAGEK